VKRSLRRFLRRRGATDAEIENAESSGYLSLLVLDRAILPGERKYTIADLAKRAGIELSIARRIWRAVGFPDLPDELPAFTDSDVETVRAFVRTFDRPWVLDWTIDRALPQARVVSASMARIADAVTDELARSFHEAADAGMSDEQIAELIADRINVEDIAALILHVYRLQLRSAAWRRLTSTDPQTAGTTTSAVGFVDLVGYTALTQMLDDDELAQLLQRFADLAHDTVTVAGGRIVKTIGDEIMFITDTAATAAQIALDLTERTEGDDVLPQTRAGMAYGPLLSHEGDYYGPFVNLASRLTELAKPGTILASSELAAELESDDRFRRRRIPFRKIRDIGRVDVFRIERR